MPLRTLVKCTALTIGIVLCGPRIAMAQGALPPDEPVSIASTNDSIQRKWQAVAGATHERRMEWWREARFGMFIHWGLYAVPAGSWNGRQLTNHGGEWIMHDYKIPVGEYAALTNQFNPVKFNAGDWVRLARDAGMKYIVVTAKHHDGFALYHSWASPFNIFDATPFKRDPLKELAAACKKYRVALGFYYSEAQDWHHPGGAARGGHWDSSQDSASMDQYIDRIAVPQVRELLLNYRPAILWWDTPYGMTPERAEKFLPLLKLAPSLITNDRLDERKLSGDYLTPEQRIPTNGPARDWETCMTMNGTWGYKSFDHRWKSTTTLVRNLVDIASKGGNFLLNVGPTAEGLIPEPSVERLKEVGAWMKSNGESIYGTTRSPLAIQPPWGRVTQKGRDLYLHVFDWPTNGTLLVPALPGKVKSASLLASSRKLKFTATADGIELQVPAEAPDKTSTTIVLRLAAAPKAK